MKTPALADLQTQRAYTIKANALGVALRTDQRQHRSARYLYECAMVGERGPTSNRAEKEVLKQIFAFFAVP